LEETIQSAQLVHDGGREGGKAKKIEARQETARNEATEGKKSRAHWGRQTARVVTLGDAGKKRGPLGTKVRGGDKTKKRDGQRCPQSRTVKKKRRRWNKKRENVQ